MSFESRIQRRGTYVVEAVKALLNLQTIRSPSLRVKRIQRPQNEHLNQTCKLTLGHQVNKAEVMQDKVHTPAIFKSRLHFSTQGLSAGGPSLPFFLTPSFSPGPNPSRLNCSCFSSISRSFLSRRSSNASDGSSTVNSATVSLETIFAYIALYRAAARSGLFNWLGSVNC